MDIQAGTRWRRKRTQGHADAVIVVKATPTSVRYRQRDLGAGFSTAPLGLFLGTYAPEPSKCARCKSDDVRPGYRHCAACTSLICAVRNKRKKEQEAVLTTTDQKLRAPFLLAWSGSRLRSKTATTRGLVDDGLAIE